MKTPPIGQTVCRLVKGIRTRDWVAQKRIGDEQFVLVWGAKKDRHAPGVDVWEEECDVVYS